jgi:hypothetical protein
MSRRLVVSVACVALMCVGAGVAVHAATGSAESDSGVCLKRPRRAMIAHGRSPGGQKWYIEGHLMNDARCQSRMLEMSFHPFGHSGASWAAGYGIPIGGSLSSTFVIVSQQFKRDGAIAYGGITSGRVALVEASTRHAQWIKIEPEMPQMPTLPSWLRNVRYFMEYLPANEKIERIRVRDQARRVLYQGDESVFGEFEDVGVL